MNEAFGLIDALEALILEGKRVPLSDRIMVSETKILELIDKLRLIIQSNGNVVHRAVDIGHKEVAAFSEFGRQEIGSAEDGVFEAQKKAEKIKSGANEYADQILANLQLTIAKMQKNLAKMDQNLESGRKMIDAAQLEEKHGAGSVDEARAGTIRIQKDLGGEWHEKSQEESQFKSIIGQESETV